LAAEVEELKMAEGELQNELAKQANAIAQVKREREQVKRDFQQARDANLKLCNGEDTAWAEAHSLKEQLARTNKRWEAINAANLNLTLTLALTLTLTLTLIGRRSTQRAVPRRRSARSPTCKSRSDKAKPSKPVCESSSA
jgi:DNA gyrase/topoisomerase IV subunit A